MNEVQPLTFQNFLWNPTACVNNSCGKCVLVALSILFKMLTFGIPYCCCRSLNGRVKKGIKKNFPACNLEPMAPHSTMERLFNCHGHLLVVKHDTFRNRFHVYDETTKKNSTYTFTKEQLEARIFYLREDSVFKKLLVNETIRVDIQTRGVVYLQNNGGEIFSISSNGTLSLTTMENIENIYKNRST